MTSPLLTAQGLGLKIQDRWLIKDLDLALKPGSFVAITGSSGSGKTTLLRTLAGDIGAAEGTINNQLECPTRLAMIFQDLQLADGATALTNVLGGSLGPTLSFPPFGVFLLKKKKAHILLNQFGLSQKQINGHPPSPVEKDNALPPAAPSSPARFSCSRMNPSPVSTRLWLIRS